MTALRCLLRFCVYATTGSVSFALADGTWIPDPSLGNVDAHQRLYEMGRAWGDQHFDLAANLIASKPKGHTHVVRESAYYAFALLLTGDAGDRAKAQPIIKKVIAAQDTRFGSIWRGAFLWYADDKWETVKNPDLNSAAFVGTALVEIANLDRQKPCLDPDVRSALDAAGRLAVEEVIRRNIDPGYTNIALLSTALASAGAKLWSVPGADKWADDKLSTVLQLADAGAVYEYSSPTYSAVDLSAAYMIRQFAFSDAFAAKGDAIINHLWKEIALAYHAPSCQLAGPYGRAYGNDMLTYAAGLKYDLYLALDGKYPLPDQLDTAHGWDQGGLALLAATPIKPRPEFEQAAPADRVWTAIGPDDGRHPARHLHQYRDGDFILGTVAFQDEWKQKRNLVADWRTNDPSSPLGFRAGFCIDESNETLPNGFPYASILFYSQQKGPAALVAQVATQDLPAGGACSLVFSTKAIITEPNVVPLVVADGAYASYIYPISGRIVRYQTTTNLKTDQPILEVNRPWTSSDHIGKDYVIAYLVVFRQANQPPPRVSDSMIKLAGEQLSVSATVDGTQLSISAPQ